MAAAARAGGPECRGHDTQTSTVLANKYARFVLQGRRLRVLVVDDNSLLRLAISESLEAHGCEVVGEAGSAGEAATQTVRLRPDVMLLDVRMPGGGGVDLLEAMANTAWRVPVVVFSADQSPTTKRRLLALGAVAVLHKGSPMWQLVESLQIAAGMK
jgi:two-component system, NarL family, invasion response regulator UvrY